MTRGNDERTVLFMSHIEVGLEFASNFVLVVTHYFVSVPDPCSTATLVLNQQEFCPFEYREHVLLIHLDLEQNEFRNAFSLGLFTKKKSLSQWTKRRTPVLRRIR